MVLCETSSNSNQKENVSSRFPPSLIHRDETPQLHLQEYIFKDIFQKGRTIVCFGPDITGKWSDVFKV